MTDAIRVLHVDDDPDLVEIAAIQLERHDDRFSVETAASADEALDRFSLDCLDCIVSDYDMPGRNGIEFLETVREDSPEIPFILYTGKGSEEVASDAISAGVTDYLQKQHGTSQYAVLANRIANAVEQYRSKREAEAASERLSLFFEQSPLGVIEWDEDFTVTRLNEQAEAILGYDEADLLGEGWEVLVPESDREQVDEVVADLLAAEGGYHSVNENVRADGERVVCEWHNRVVTDDAGDTVAVFSQFQDVTERDAHERELERYEAYLEGSTDIITVLDETGEVKYQSPSTSRILGYEAEALVGDNGFDYVHPDDVDQTFETFSEVVANPGATVRTEARFRTAAGDWRWLEIRGRNYLDHPQIEGIVTNNRDITARKKREEQLEETSALLSTLFEGLPVGVLAEDEFRNVLAANERFVDLFELGGDPTDLVGADCRDLAREASSAFADPAGFVERIDDLIADPVSVDNEPLELADGQHFERSHRPIDLADGEGHLWVYQDVTERLARERELADTNALLTALFETLPVGVTVLDEDGSITRANRRAEEVLGLTESELTARRYDDPEWAIVDDSGAAVTDDALPFEQVIETGDPIFDVEHGIRNSDGEERWLSINAAPLTDDDPVQSVVAVISDVTDQREYERTIERQNERLAEFASVVSHDLRNPLTVAEGKLALAREETDSEHLEGLGRALDRMGTLIEDLLTLAREGVHVSEPEPTDLASLVRACWDNVDARGATLRTDVDGRVRADPKRLQQLLENLYRNAVEHGGPEVRVTVGELATGFYVADDGPGIPADEREAVFEAGYSTSDGGTGFGLRIVQQIVEAHGWEIAIEEGPAGGARFEITGVEFVE